MIRMIKIARPYCRYVTSTPTSAMFKTGYLPLAARAGNRSGPGLVIANHRTYLPGRSRTSGEV